MQCESWVIAGHLLKSSLVEAIIICTDRSVLVVRFRKSGFLWIDNLPRYNQKAIPHVLTLTLSSKYLNAS